MSDTKTFIDACFAGRATLEDVDDWVDVWHDSSGKPRGSAETLGHYLGMSDFEYALWAERPSVLRAIVAARHQERPIASIEAAADYALAAARTGNDREAAKLIEWLKRSGRINGNELPKSC